MKFTKSVIVFSIFTGLASAVAAQQQTINGYPVPANATTGNARAVVGVAPLTTEGIAPLVAPLIPPAQIQTAFDKSWTTYFIGQTRYNSDGNPVTIQADGSLNYAGIVVAAPVGRTVARVYSFSSTVGGTGSPICSTVDLIAYPSFTASEIAQGERPSNWTFLRQDYGTPGACPGDGSGG